MTVRIDHITIVVRDSERAKEFFQKLGFVVKQEGELSGEWFDTLTRLKNVKARYTVLSLAGNETNIELLTFDYPEGEECPAIDIPMTIGYRHVAFAVDDINNVVSKFKKQGVKFFSDIQEYKKTKKKLCYFYGPEGILLELAEYKNVSGLRS
jgi:catechol 2,3-dioxygenase-like lactoylglutathione lyase family enzyme